MRSRKRLKGLPVEHPGIYAATNEIIRLAYNPDPTSYNMKAEHPGAYIDRGLPTLHVFILM